MSNSFPFPTGLYRAIGEDQITVVAHDDDGEPTAVCVYAHSAAERAIALALLEKRSESFVVSHGLRYSPDGTVQPYDSTRPSYAGELRLLFDMEWVTLGPQPRIYVFTHTEQEWETARQAMKHLLQAHLLSPRSYLEGDHTGKDQGLSAENLDGQPHAPWLVAQFREAAIRAQNGEEGGGIANDLFLVRALTTKEQHEHDEWEDDAWEDDAWMDDEWGDGERKDDEWEAEETWEEEAGPGEKSHEGSTQEVPAPLSRLIQVAIARWRKGGRRHRRFR